MAWINSEAADFFNSVSGCARLHSLDGKFRIFVHRQKTNLTLGIFCFSLPTSVQPIQQRHCNINHNDVGLQAVAEEMSAWPIGYNGDHVETQGHQVAQCFRHQGVIIGQNRAGQSWFSLNGGTAGCKQG